MIKSKTRRSPTMLDVAKAAGVTQATVSYVLNGRGEVSEVVQRRVLEAADRIGYIPNMVARNLRMNQSNLIGIIVPDVMNSYFSEMIKRTESVTREHGYFSFVCNANHDPQLEDWYVRSLIQNKVAGVTICYGLTNRSCIEKLKQHGVPFVVLDDDPTEGCDDAPCILMNNIRGSYLAVEHFASLGIDNIAYITESIYSQALRYRLEGFNRAINELGLHCAAIHIAPSRGDWDMIVQGYTGAGEVLDRCKPTGIFVSSDQMASGVLKKLRELGVRVPEDIAVIGYDNVPLSSLVTPALTTIDQPLGDMCEQGAQMLLGIMSGIQSSGYKLVLEPSLIVRESAPYRFLV